MTVPSEDVKNYLIRVAKSGIPTALALGLLGYLFAQLAGYHVESSAGDRSAVSRAEFAQFIQMRLALAMAGWGIALVAIYELIAGYWARPVFKDYPPGVDSEGILMELLDQAEKAETIRQSAMISLQR